MHTKYMFSIIIPVYNVEKYLKQCLDSVYRQTFTDYEVICVEDASSDHSLNILKDYAAEHPMRILINDQNCGLSEARNRGLKSAKGEYILFLDSDDYISEKLLEIMAGELKRENYDFLTFDSKAVYDKDVKYKLSYDFARKNQYPEIYDGQELYVLQLKQGDYEPTVWQYCYNRQFLKENALYFIAGRYNEDEPFSFQAYMRAKRIRVLSATLHYYRIRNGSIMSYDKIVERMLDNIDSYIEYIQFYIQSQGKNTNLAECAGFQVERGALGILDSYSNLTYEKRILLEKSMRNDLQRLFLREILSRNEGKIFCKEAAEQLNAYEKTYVYGAGKYAEKVIWILNKERIKLEGILVSDASENPEKFHRYNVYEYDLVKEQLSGSLIIIGMAEKNSSEILEKLRNDESVGILECKYLFV